MIMLIDTLSERYGMLPSEVITRANTFDVFIADTAIGYRNAVQERAMNGDKKPTPKLSEQTMMAAMERVRGKS
jgi:hypothetical protein